jgi:hypothetical protein
MKLVSLVFFCLLEGKQEEGKKQGKQERKTGHPT